MMAGAFEVPTESGLFENPSFSFLGVLMRWKSALWAILTGAVFGEILVVLLGPGLILWYWTPPKQQEFTCTEPIHWALTRLQAAQAIGLAVGATLGALIYLLFARKVKRAKAADSLGNRH